jgi:hypothetical protein
MRSAGTPYLGVPIDLVPFCGEDFVEAPGGQDEKFEHGRGRLVAGAQALDEGRDLSVRHGGVVGILVGCCENLVERALPARRIRPLDVESDVGGVEHRLDPAPDPRRGRGGLVPHRFEQSTAARSISVIAIGPRISATGPLMMVASHC